MKKKAYIISAVILSAGIWAAGYSVGKGIYNFKKLSQTVTVKGIAEMPVISDLGVWEINYREVGNDLTQINTALQHDQQVCIDFLKQHGFVDGEIGRSSLRVEDRFANVYQEVKQENASQPRYVVTGGVSIRSNNVYQIDKAVQVSSQLLQQGVPVAFDVSSYSPNPSYYYMGLDKIRAQMMSDATKSAKLVADQFAKDSQTKLGGVQHASQGVFQIMGADTSTMSADWNSNQNSLGSIAKKVRLVTTIDYRLK